MRNLKRVLSTIMALAMLLSVVVISTSANTLTFDDQDKIVHREAVDMAVALKIILGYEDGTFRPEGNITRAEMTKMIAVLMHGGMEPILGTNPSGATFTDIRGHWAEKYIEYCVAEGIVAGMGDGTFDPDGNVTGTQAAKMLLVALGYRADLEDFNTSNWATRIAVCAADRKLFQDVNVDPNAALSRDNAAQMIWNALQAYEVEYVNEWYMDANGNPATRMVARDKTQSASSDFITLLRDKYDCDIFTLTLWQTDWSKADKVFKYSFGSIAWVAATENEPGHYEYKASRSYQSAVDYSDYFGMEVKVVVKNDGKTILGMVLGNSTVLAEAPVDLYEGVDGEYAIKVDGVKFRVESDSGMGAGPAEKAKDVNKVVDLEAFAINVPAPKTLGDANVAFTGKLIDHDGNGRGDYVVYTPFSVGKVSNLTSDTVTITRGSVDGPTLLEPNHLGLATSLDLADIKYYEGMAKNDYVVIYPEANTPYATEVIEKMASQEGELTRMVGDYTWYIDGTAYDVHADAKANIGKVSLSNEYIVYYVNGFIFWQELGASNYTIDDILFVAQYAPAAADLTNDRAKVYFAKDGTKATIEVNEIFMTGDNDAEDELNANDLEGRAQYKLFTFTEKNGLYSLTKIDEDNTAGFDDYNVKTKTNADPLAKKGDGITASTSKTPGTLNSMSIDNDAVIFMIGLDSKGKTDFKVVKGTNAKDLSNDFGTAAAAEGTLETLTTTSNSRNIVKVAVVHDTATKLPSFGKSSYAYVVSSIGSSRVGSDTYTTYTMFGADGDVFVYDEKKALGSKYLYKGAVITFDDMGENYIENSDSAGGRVAASLGMLDDGTIQFAYPKTENSIMSGAAGDLFTADDDTLILLVDTSVPKGITRGTIADLDAASKNDLGKLIANCYFVADDDNLLELVVIDTKGVWNHDGYAGNSTDVAPAAVDKDDAAFTINATDDPTKFTALVPAAAKQPITITIKLDGAAYGAKISDEATSDTVGYTKNADGTYKIGGADAAAIVDGSTFTFKVTSGDEEKTVTHTITFADPVGP